MSQLLTDAVCGEDVPAWVESVDELDAEKAWDAAVERADELARGAARAHYWRDELESTYPDGPLGPSATPGAWLRWIFESGADGFKSPEDPGVAVWVSEGRDAASLVVWATPRTWTEATGDPVSLVLATLRCSPGQGADSIDLLAEVV
jgi:hypothetical protein